MNAPAVRSSEITEAETPIRFAASPTTVSRPAGYCSVADPTAGNVITVERAGDRA